MGTSRDLAVWFKNGQTAYFKDVEIFRIGGVVLEFAYTSVANKQRKQATFFVEKLAGWSITTEEFLANG